MPEPQDLATLLNHHIRTRLPGKSSQALARAVNERFAEPPGVDFLTRNTIDNWLRGYVKTVRDWDKLAAVAAVLGLPAAEADALLRSAGQIPIAEKRQSAERALEHKILAHWPSTDAAQPTPPIAPLNTAGNVPPTEQSRPGETIVPEVPDPGAKNVNSDSWQRWLGSAGIGLLLLVGAWFGWPQWATQSTPPPNQPTPVATPFYVDDFTNPGRWDRSEAPNATFNDRRLWFDSPVNDSSGWRADVVNPQWSVEIPLTRIRFTVALEMSPDQTWGFLGVQTECYSEQYADDNGDNDWLLVYIGGPERTLWVEYTPLEAQVPLQELPLAPITTGQPYTVDLIWTQPGVQVYLDGAPQGKVIPCLRPRQFNFNAGLYPETQVRGYIDDLQMWH